MLVELFGEVCNTLAQHARVERNVHARNRDVGAWINRVSLALQGGKAALRARHGVLLALDVVVDNLQELAGILRNTSDVRFDLFRADTDHVRAQRAHAVVGVALRIAWHQGTHGGATRVHDVDDRFQVKDVAQGCKRGVLTERVARKVRTGGQRVGLVQSLRLRVGDNGHGHLRELGQVQDAIRVFELQTADDQARRVVLHNALDGEPVGLTRVAVSAAPHVARGSGSSTVAVAHALGLNALAGVDVGGARLGQKRLTTGDDVAGDAAGHLKGLLDADAADALDGDLYIVVKLHHAVHGVGPADDLAVASSQVLCGGG